MLTGRMKHFIAEKILRRRVHGFRRGDRVYEWYIFAFLKHFLLEFLNKQK